MTDNEYIIAKNEIENAFYDVADSLDDTQAETLCDEMEAKLKNLKLEFIKSRFNINNFGERVMLKDKKTNQVYYPHNTYLTDFYSDETSIYAYEVKIANVNLVKDIEKFDILPYVLKRWKRYRFKTKSIEDNRPLIYNARYPCWCSGHGDDHDIMVAYLPYNEDLLKYWDDAFDIDFSEEEKIVFSERFSKPDDFIES